MFKHLVMLFCLLIATYALTEEERIEITNNCETNHNISERYAYSYLSGNEPAPEEAKGFFVCILQGYGIISNATLTEESLEEFLNSNDEMSSEEISIWINELKACLDTEEPDLQEQVYKFLRCGDRRNNTNVDLLLIIIANCVTTHNVIEDDAYEYLSNNDTAPENVKEFFVCLLEGFGYIANDTITDESLHYTIESNNNIPNERKAQMITDFTVCLDSTETNLNEKVFEMLRCRVQNMIREELLERD